MSQALFPSSGIVRISREALRCWAEISRTALAHNLHLLKKAAPGAEILPAVKANAYGHGVALVAPQLEHLGVAMFGVACVGEALELRSVGVKSPVLILSSCLPAERPVLIEAGFSAVVSSAEEVRALNREAGKLRCVARVHAKIDTGMGRLGIWHKDAASLFTALSRANWLQLEGLMTHFSSADTDKALTQAQWDRFQAVIATIPAKLRGGLKIHAANSAGLLNHRYSHGDLVRPGIALYGYPGAGRTALHKQFKPVMTWKARISLIKEVGRGRTLSYGATFSAPRNMKIAVVSAGYADGYSRLLSNQTSVLIRGHRCKLVGRVTMDQILVDVTHLPSPRVSEEVVLMGPGVDAESMAAKIHTVSYEVLTSVGDRVARVDAP